MTSIDPNSLFTITANPRQIGPNFSALNIDSINTNIINDNGAGTVTVEDPVLNTSVGGTVLGAPNGLATLDAGGYLPLSQVPPSLGGGLDARPSVRVKTITTLPAYTQSGTGVGATLTANANGVIPTIDGITLVNTNRILVDDYGTATGKDRGIYVVTSIGSGGSPWILTRAFDADEDIDVTSGMNVFVEEGISNSGNGYVLVTPNPITVDTTSLSFFKYTATSYTIDLAFNNTNVTNSTSYTTLAMFPFNGTNFIKPPNTLNIITRMDVGITSYNIRLQNTTSNTTLSTNTGYTNTNDNIVVIPLTSITFPTTPSILEIQGARVGGDNTMYVYLQSVQIR